MSRHSCDGAGLLAAFHAAVDNLAAHVDEVNALNVYPVPDGDTGSNMLATVRAALQEADEVAEKTAGNVAAAISFGALMGARGNSGVIASQIFRGMAEGIEGKKRVNGVDLAHALSEGSATAYKAVVKPVEGTILTVMREAAAAGVAAAEADGDLEAVLTAAVDVAEHAVERTPMLLAILREAGVVDAGGKGLYLLMQGALRYLVAEEAAREQTVAEGVRTRAAARASALVAHADEGYGYETMFLLQARSTAQPLDVDRLRIELEKIGNSVIVAGDRRAVKVHVHNERPDQVLALALGMGTLTKISVENLDSQAHDVRERRAAELLEARPATPGAEAVAGAAGARVDQGVAEAGDDRTERPGSGVAARPGAARPGARPGAAQPAAALPEAAGGTGRNGRTASSNGRNPADASGSAASVHAAHVAPLAIVAVAAGDGLARILDSFGVARIVRGGQTDNPSTGELLAAVADIDAEHVLLLPNNPNVVMAARQVADMTHQRVRVVPTRNAAEGFAALLAFDPTRDATANAEVMTLAGRGVQTLQVTDAIRDASVGGRKVKKGQTIVLDPDDGLRAVDSDRTKAILAALDGLEPGFELLTIYYGDGADLEDAEHLARRLGEWRPGVEIEVIHGGQPHYRYLIAAE